MLVLQHGFVFLAQIAGQGREAQRRKERVLNGPEEGTLGLGEGRENEFDSHGRIPGSGGARKAAPLKVLYHTK
jgi:hypothetical protein